MSANHAVKRTAVPTDVGDGNSSGRSNATIEALTDIGMHLRSARAAHQISLREMARRIGVSPSFVSQVELGKAKPSLGTLYSFLSELDLSLEELMSLGVSSSKAAPVNRQTFLNSAKRGVTTTRSRMNGEHLAQAWENHPIIQMKGVTWRRLTSEDPAVDFLHVTYEPGSESCPMDHLMRHEGHEYGHIISGTLQVQVAFETFDLQAGDAINFPSTTPHRLFNQGQEICTSTWVVVGRRSPSESSADFSARNEVPGH